MAIKKKKIRQAVLYNIKTSEDKTERILNEGNKALFQERENKGAFHWIYRDAYIRYMITQT